MNLSQIRTDTPGLEDKLFVNSAGSSLPPSSVNENIAEYLQREAEIGGYQLAALRDEQNKQFYAEAAKLLNTQPQNIAFAHDATDAFIKALLSIPFEPGDVILTTDDDYASSYIQFISLQNRMGVRIARASNLENGDLDIDDFQQKLDALNPKLVAVTHIPTNSGLVQDVETIGDLCQQRDIWYLVDACQSVGQIVVDVQNIKCDFLTGTGRKFLRGPRGTGLLYVSDKVLNKELKPLMPDLGSATWTDTLSFEMVPTAKRFETWERSFALINGLTEAIRCANDIGIKAIQTYNEQLVGDFRKNLSSIKGVALYDYGFKTCNIVTWRKEGKSKEEIISDLDKNRVYFSTPTTYNALLDFRKKGVDWVIRFSPHYFNTVEELNNIIEIVDDI